MALQFASPVLRDDRAIVMVAVKSRGCVLEFASPRLQGDKGIVLAAVSNRGSALKYATERMRGDPEIVLTAMKNDTYAFGYALNPAKVDDVVCRYHCNAEGILDQSSGYSAGQQCSSAPAGSTLSAMSLRLSKVLRRPSARRSSM